MERLEHFQKHCSHSREEKNEAVSLGFGVRLRRKATRLKKYLIRVVTAQDYSQPRRKLQHKTEREYPINQERRTPFLGMNSDLPAIALGLRVRHWLDATRT